MDGLINNIWMLVTKIIITKKENEKDEREIKDEKKKG